jgi:CBS domain-containing protein
LPLERVSVAMSQKLRKIMVANVITAKPNDSIGQVATLMNKHEIGCVIIVGNGKPVGVVTERDMIKRVVCRSKEAEKEKVAEIMSKPLVEASPEMLAGDAAKLMLEKNIKKLPVVENGQLLGLVTLTDLIRSEGVVEFLNGLSLKGISPRLKKAVDIYFDAEQFFGQSRKLVRRCPLIMKDGISVGCSVDKCMWWTGEECAISQISRHLEAVLSE